MTKRIKSLLRSESDGVRDETVAQQTAGTSNLISKRTTIFLTIALPFFWLVVINGKLLEVGR
jgi:hypothetical protein